MPISLLPASAAAFAPQVHRQRRPQHQGRALVNTDFEEGQPSQAPVEQRTATRALPNRDPLRIQRHLVALLHHGPQGPGFGTAQGLQPPGRSPLQLPADPHRGLRRARRHGFAT